MLYRKDSLYYTVGNINLLAAEEKLPGSYLSNATL